MLTIFLTIENGTEVSDGYCLWDGVLFDGQKFIPEHLLPYIDEWLDSAMSLKRWLEYSDEEVALITSLHVLHIKNKLFPETRNNDFKGEVFFDGYNLKWHLVHT